MKIVTIGRDSGNDIVVNDSTASRWHCEIVQDEYGDFVLKDTKSTNGTYVNGMQRRGTIRLNKTDIVRVGNTTLPWQTYFSGGSGGGGTIIPSSGSYSNPTPGGGVQPPQTKPDNFLVWSILCTIFCCIPFGIVSIVKATRVDKLWDSGDYFGAERAARDAKTWFWWGLAVGFVDKVVGIIIMTVGGVAGMFV